MDLDDYRTRMGAAHQQLQNGMLQMLQAYGQVQTIFTDVLRDVSTSINDLKETQEELRRLVLEQGAEIRELRTRLNGHE